MFFMKINRTNRLLQVYNNMEINKTKTSKKASEKDKIQFSERAMDYQFALNKLREVPDMRIEKVEKLKKQIKTGNYNISGKEIVDKIYENINFDKKI